MLRMLCRIRCLGKWRIQPAPWFQAIESNGMSVYLHQTSPAAMQAEKTSCRFAKQPKQLSLLRRHWIFMRTRQARNLGWTCQILATQRHGQIIGTFVGLFGKQWHRKNPTQPLYCIAPPPSRQNGSVALCLAYIFELNNVSNGRQSDANDFYPIRGKNNRSIKTCRLKTFSDGMFHY